MHKECKQIRLAWYCAIQGIKFSAPKEREVDKNLALGLKIGQLWQKENKTENVISTGFIVMYSRISTSNMT